MQTQKVTKNKNNSDVKVNIDDLAFHIQFLLQMSSGSQLAAALGFPNEATNDEAVKKWVRANFIFYYKKERSEMAHEMAEALNDAMFHFFEIGKTKTIQ